MKEEKLQSWEDFENKVAEFIGSNNKVENKLLHPSNVLFRGHGDADWHLTTTLERYMGDKITLIDYYDLVYKAKSRVETFTNRVWDIPIPPDYYSCLEEYDSLGGGEFPALDYLAYLRHQGFPSPLLDWTTSPYIAAYFAFRDLTSKANSIAIFVYKEYGGYFKAGRAADTNIHTLGNYIRPDKRHFLQQSTYTICTTDTKQQAYYSNHEEVFARDKKNQDLLWKFSIPATERQKALKKLEIYNINAYSLFGSEESLMETIFLREFFLKK